MLVDNRDYAATLRISTAAVKRNTLLHKLSFILNNVHFEDTFRETAKSLATSRLSARLLKV